MRKTGDIILRWLTYKMADLDRLVFATGRSRKTVLMSLGLLMRAGLVQCRRPKPALEHDESGRITANNTPATVYFLTPKGHAFVRAEKRFTGGPRGPLTGQRKTRKDTFCARLWRAFRMKPKATAFDLIEIARIRSDGGGVANNAHQFLRRLVNAGVAVRLRAKARGAAPTSPGLTRYALVRDLGPLAPLATAKHVFDPNGGTIIPYKEISRGDAEARR